MQLVLRLQAELQILGRVERGKCGHAFYERPCDDKNSSNFTLPGCGADPRTALRLSTFDGLAPVGGGTSTAQRLLLLKLDKRSAFGMGQGDAGRHAGTPQSQAFLGPRSVWGVGQADRPNEMAKARGEMARCSVAFVTEDLGLEA